MRLHHTKAVTAALEGVTFNEGRYELRWCVAENGRLASLVLAGIWVNSLKA